MKTIFKTLALGLLLMSVASCEKHDPFDENTFTGAVGPEAYWEVASSIVKAGGAMNFEGKYYSIVADIDHSEVWYDLWEQEDKLVTASLIKAFTFSETSSIPTQKRILQTIQSYKHDSTMWSDSLRAYYIADKFPVSFTLSPVAWVQPKDTNGFTKNLHQYFGETYAQGFKKRLTEKMNPSADERNFAAYKNVIDGLGLLRDTILTPNVRTETSESYKKGHPLENELLGVTLHHTAFMDPDLTGVVSHLTNPKTEASSHVVIGYDGSRKVLANPKQVTFHAG